MQDKEFTRSNKVFTGMIVKLKRDGLDKTKHHGAISDSDLNKLRESNVLNTISPKGYSERFGLTYLWASHDADKKTFKN